jgi:hypothetical protein
MTCESPVSRVKKCFAVASPGVEDQGLEVGGCRSRPGAGG